MSVPRGIFLLILPLDSKALSRSERW